MPLLLSRDAALGAKGRLYSACMCIVMLYGSETCPDKEDLITLERNDAKMARWMCNVRPEDRICSEEFRTRLKLKSMREYVQDRRLQ